MLEKAKTPIVEELLWNFPRWRTYDPCHSRRKYLSFCLWLFRVIKTFKSIECFCVLRCPDDPGRNLEMFFYYYIFIAPLAINKVSSRSVFYSLRCPDDPREDPIQIYEVNVFCHWSFRSMRSVMSIQCFIVSRCPDGPGKFLKYTTFQTTQCFWCRSFWCPDDPSPDSTKKLDNLYCHSSSFRSIQTFM